MLTTIRAWGAFGPAIEQPLSTSLACNVNDASNMLVVTSPVDFVGK